MKTIFFLLWYLLLFPAQLTTLSLTQWVCQWPFDFWDADVWSRFCSSRLVEILKMKVDKYLYKNHSNLGTVVPLAMFKHVCKWHCYLTLSSPSLARNIQQDWFTPCFHVPCPSSTLIAHMTFVTLRSWFGALHMKVLKTLPLLLTVIESRRLRANSIFPLFISW